MVGDVLQELNIQDFAIVDNLQLELEPGFNVLTGETGAGKSILIDAVALLLGGRADTTAVRAGAERARIEGRFWLSEAHQAQLAPLLEREALEYDGPELWLSREVRASGRSVARINGVLVAVSVLRELAEGLVDIHGQSEHLSLLRVREHLNLLDRFGELEPLRADVATVARQLQAARQELAALREGVQLRAQRIEMLRFQVQEIEAAAPEPGETEALEAELNRLVNAEQLNTVTANLILRLAEGVEEAPAVLDLLGQAQRDLHGLVRIDPTLESSATLLDEVGYQLEEVARALREYLAQVEFSAKRLTHVEARLALLRQLERKYGGDLLRVLAHARQAATELAGLERSDERIAELVAEEAVLVTQLGALAAELSARRQAAAQQLAASVEAELQDLRMEGARFGVAFALQADSDGVPLAAPTAQERWALSSGMETQAPVTVERAACDTTGMDQVEFLIAPNVGEGLKPLHKIASGGETARLMLALKAVLARADHTPTLIFDEIDQGIGGRVGNVVGAKLWRLTGAAEAQTTQHQVLCITHLPQLAGFGDVHYQVVKQVVNGRTVTQVVRLDETARLQELAQMLGTQGEAATQGAQELLAHAARI
ncbi:MAG TPA: DNA repair protein RecN, partial [Chloroflexi bacterium]|nr:DNA repair protein RecN [Chloroflexota bacterium]